MTTMMIEVILMMMTDVTVMIEVRVMIGGIADGVDNNN